MTKILMMDQRLISLMQELPNHPILYARMSQAIVDGKNAHALIFTMGKEDEIPVIDTFEQGIAYIAAQVDVLVHGTYTHEEFCNLCEILRKRLEEKRTINLDLRPADVVKAIQSDYKH
ncbi:MAG: hypothetical protein [Bacteriophage sp.]|nr:MAG: hypothetical protein [Bacteriophage sp.]